MRHRGQEASGVAGFRGFYKNGGRKKMETKLTREEALTLLKKYNKEAFHILHGLTVEGVSGGLPVCSMILTLNFIQKSTAIRRRSFLRKAEWRKH